MTVVAISTCEQAQVLDPWYDLPNGHCQVLEWKANKYMSTSVNIHIYVCMYVCTYVIHILFPLDMRIMDYIHIYMT